MLFEFCRCTPVLNSLASEYYLLEDIKMHDGYLEATMISSMRGVDHGQPFFVKNLEPKKFYAVGPFTLIEYNGPIR